MEGIVRLWRIGDSARVEGIVRLWRIGDSARVEGIVRLWQIGDSARVEGIEPPIAVLETAVIPLNYTRKTALSISFPYE